MVKYCGVIILYLKGLEIQGFKSFVDKVKIDLGQGISAIVGPNGSGKSNISDAIRWVMGEQSVKTLRGSKMEDIIFSGTQKRKATGFAEVTMIIDNSSGLLNVDYDEVAITRRVFRSGEGEYFINKTACRLKDIHELLMDTGLGRDGYSVVGQGKIDEILYAKPEDRRQMFEEAAGISKYKYRKAEAERKLAQTEENLIRLKDIIKELQVQVGPLKIQSEKAKQYIVLSEELKMLEVNVALDVIDKRRKMLDDIKSVYDVTVKSLENEKAQLDEAENRLNALYDGIKDKDDTMQAFKDRQHSLEMENLNLQSNITLLENQIKNAEENIDRINAQIIEISNSDEKRAQELKNLLGTVDELNEKKAAISISIDKQRNEAQQLFDKAQAKSDELQSKRDLINSMTNQIIETKNKIDSFLFLQDNYENRLQKMASETNEILSEQDKHEKKLLEFKDTLKKDNDEAEKLSEKTAQMINEYEAITKETEDLKDEYNKIGREENQNQSRRHLLDELEKDMDGYSNGVKAVLREKSLKGIEGVVSKLIKVDDRYITAIEVALGNGAQNIVVEKEQDAKNAIEFLKQNKQGRVTFLPLNAVKPRIFEGLNNIKICKGFIDVAANLCEHDSKISPAISSLLGAVAVVDNMDNAIFMAQKFSYKFKIVTLDGGIINSGGSITGGSINKASSLMGREKEIALLDVKLKEAKVKMDKLEQDIDDREDKLDCLKGEIERIRSKRRELETGSVKNQSEIELKQAILENLEKRLKNINSEIDSIKSSVENADEEKKNFFDAIKKTEAQIEVEKLQLTILENEFKSLKEEQNDAGQLLMQKTIELNSIVKDIELFKEKEQALINMAKSRNDVIALRKDEEKVLLVQIEGIRSNIMKVQKEIESNNLKIEEQKQKVEASLEERAKTDSEIAKLRDEAKDQRERVFALQQETARIEARQAKAQAELEATINRLWDDYEETYSTALKLKKGIPNMADAGRRISAIKSEIKGLGSINVAAIEEYKTVSERYEFLCAQNNDLESAVIDLQKVIKDMTQVMSKQFSEQFEVIKQKFSETFVSLLGGGTAVLRLNNDDNVLESGIEIEVQPPGKKLQNIMLLSGGEKAFVSIALLFALLEVRPSPFCILDEIEAALDESNVYKFADYLKKHTSKIQFIVITHRRGTMEASDVLYGVTMQEKGISKILSMRLEEYNAV